MSSRTAFARIANISALGLATIMVTVDAAGVVRASTGTEPPSDAGADTIDGRFDVGGRNLYLKCEGSGSPTVVYLHGSGGTSSNAGEIPSLLSDDYRVCVYDRANVGRSDPEEGPLTAANAVADLHTLLDVAEVPGPYLLLGASFGGDIAFTYAGTHPDDVNGVVVLDPNLPGIRAWEQEFVPAEFLPPEDALEELWKDDPEQMDPYGSMDQLDTAADTFPAVPAILFALEEYEFPPEFGEGAEAALHDLQQDAMDLFDPGQVRIVDTPHYMEPEIPDEISAAVREVIATATEGSAPPQPTTST
jgi:pimeloyl-ACP methyl ester carboxylesterase